MLTRPLCYPAAITFFALGLAAHSAPARADDAEPIKEKLFQAKKAYDADVQKFRKAITDTLDKREDDARKAGNKKVVDQVKVERAAFEKSGELPTGIPTAIRDAGIAARAKLDKTYVTAVKDCLRMKLDEAADAIDKEHQEFRLAAAFLFGRRTYLSSLRHFDVKASADFFKNNGTSHEGNKLKLDGDLVPHTILLHPPSMGSAHVSYPLGGKWTTFRSSVGVPKVEGNPEFPSPLTFEVMADGKSIWKSKPVTKTDAFQPFAINVEKVKTLTLSTHCPESNRYAWAIWVEPILGE